MDVGDLRAGVADAGPLLLGVIPFGLVAGIAAADAGLDLTQAVAMSMVVFAGASQLAALDLIGRDAPLAVVIVTAVVINLRMLMYSASLAPYFGALSGRWRAGLAYLLTDQAYAMSVAEFRSEQSYDRRAYYLGVAGTLWVVWQVTTAVGVLAGTGVPDAWGLEFAVPLVFLALLVPAMEDGPASLAAVVGGAVALGGTGLPLNLGLLAGATAGVVAGFAAETVTGVADDD